MMDRIHQLKGILRSSRPRLLVLVGLIVICLIAGCAGKNNSIKDDSNKGLFSWFRSAVQPVPEDEVSLSEKAMDFFARRRYLLAEEVFQKIRDRYPFSHYSTLAELRLADCKFYMGSYEEAIPLYEEFEKLHPTNEAIPYVIFQEGSSYYKLMASPDRDQTFTHKLIETYGRLLKRYPENPFGYEARKRIKEARDHLARHEFLVAGWYIRTGHLPQAKNRLEVIMDLYPDTSARVEAEGLLKEERIAQATLTAEPGAEKEPEESWWRGLIPFI